MFQEKPETVRIARGIIIGIIIVVGVRILQIFSAQLFLLNMGFDGNILWQVYSAMESLLVFLNVPLAAGIAGYYAGKKGWAHGILLGLIAVMVSIVYPVLHAFVSAQVLPGANFPSNQELWSLLTIRSPEGLISLTLFTVILTAASGIIGEYIARKRQERKINPPG